MSKASTTPYNVACARGEFQFIDSKFIPPGHPDTNEYEGGVPDNIHAQPAPSQPNPNLLSICISIPESFRPVTTHSLQNESVNTYQTIPIKDSVPGSQPDNPTPVASPVSKLTIKLPSHAHDERYLPTPTLPSQSQIANGSQNTRCTFCAEEYQESIVDMMATHLCAHPLIPGYAYPSPEGI
jgi:hypothetical protein